MTSARTDDAPTEAKTFTLANGIELLITEAPPRLLKDMADEIAAAQPQPPMVRIEDHDRDEPNEDDPEYKRATRQWASDSGWRMLYTLAAVAVTVTNVPEGINAHDTDAWAEDMEVLYGLPLEAHPRRRLAQWLLYQTTDSDLLDLSPILFYQAGAPEEEVQRALDAFRSNTERTADQQGPTANGSGPDGDSIHPNPAGNRRARRRASRSKP